MTIAQAIETVKSVKPHQYDDATVVRWLSDLDGRVWQDIYSSAENIGDMPELPYSRTDLGASLLIGFPHEDVYVKWICAQIDYANAEIERYQNDMIMFSAAYQSFVDAFNRQHKVKTKYVSGIRGSFA